MATRTLSVVFLGVMATLAMGVGAEVSAESETPQTIAMERLAEAKDLWRRKADYNAALAAFNAAVEMAPENVNIRLQRGGFFEVVASIVVEQDKEKFKQYARDDYEFVAQADPDSIAAGVARDGLGRLDGVDLFPVRSVNCPDDAVQAYNHAESLFRQDSFEESLRFFGVATSACPDSAPMLVSHADVYYMLKDYEKARAIFLKALSADPWNRRAHRFLSDTENRLGNNEAALRQAALAVVSDPTYEAAWSSLRAVSRVLDRGWHRVYGEAPKVTRDQVNKDGQKSDVSVIIQSPKKGAEAARQDVVLEVAAPEEDEAEVDPDQVLWMAYGAIKAAVVTGTIMEVDESGHPVAREIDSESMSPFEIEERTVLDTLSVMQELADPENEEPVPAPGPFWTMIHRAAEAGFLKEAIFLHLPDESMVEEYLTYRGDNAERLVEYLEALITPVANKESASKRE